MVVSHHMGVGTEFRSSGRGTNAPTNAPEPQVTTPLKLYMHTVAHAYIYTIMSKSNEIMKAQQLVLGLQSPKEEMMRPEPLLQDPCDLQQEGHTGPCQMALPKYLTYARAHQMPNTQSLTS